MTSAIQYVAVDCRNAYELSQWWKPVLGYADIPDDPNEPGHEECVIEDPAGSGQALIFLEVPEPKTLKNRLHLDLLPTDATRDEEIARVLALGATEVADHRKPDGTGWMVLADPEGNEFCVLRSAAERAESAGTRPA